MKINNKHDFYRRSQYYRNSTSSLMLKEQQQTSGLITTPSETSMTRLSEDDKDCPDSTDTTDPLWYSSDEGTDDEAGDSACIIISHKALSSANEAGRFDEESGYDAKPVEKSHSSTGVRSSRRVRFSDTPPDVCSYEKPGIDCYNDLYYTGHEMQKMQLEYYMEIAGMASTMRKSME
jgi:hypothetical protein